jgi:ribosomal protein S18 acetylase RimI-like enzyme
VSAAGAGGSLDAAVAAAIEARAARAVAATEVVEPGGWLLRATPGSSRKRSNSALPLIGAAHDVDVVAAFYSVRGLRPIVQVSPLELHADLDAALAARRWEVVSPTDVLVADTAAVAAAALPAPGVTVAFDGERRRAIATATLAGLPAGAGAVVADDGWAGLFALETVPAARRRGVARTLVGALARWSAANGCGRLYLQVESDNAPAQALYRALGFARSHGYHYRRSRANLTLT